MRPQVFQICALLGISAGIALGQTQSTFTLTANPTQSFFGDTVTLTAVANPSPGTVTVTFRDGGQTGTIIGTSTMTNGVATFSISNLGVGTHSLIASFPVAGSAAPRFSTIATETVSARFVLTSSPNPSTIGNTVTLTATSTPPVGTPTVTFRDGGQTGPIIGSAPMGANSGAATVTVSNLTQGIHQLIACYTTFLGNAAQIAPRQSGGITTCSNVVSQTVNLVSTTTSLANSPNPSTLCQPVTLTATVTRASSVSNFGITGNVAFFDGQTQVGATGVNFSAQTNQGTAIVTVTPLTAGNHSFTATYFGDNNYAGSSGPQTQVVTKVVPTVSLTSLPNPSNPGQNVTMTATVTGCNAGSTPIPVTGSVSFLDGGATLQGVNLTSGTATFQTTALASGTHPLTATYNGDTNYGARTSSTVNQVVGSNTAISLTANPNPSTFGQNVTLTATITPSNTTGNVQFFDNGSTTPLGQASVISGTASFQISTFAVGSHSLTAVLGSSTSTPAVLTVNKASTTTTLSANPAASNPGQTVTFTATVAPSGATGQVQFRDSGVTIGTGNLSNGTATFTTANLATSAHTITAVYVGDTNFNTSTSNPVNITVGQGTSSTNLTVTPNPAAAGQPVTMTATVSPSTATGTVAFRDNGVTIQNNVTLSNGTAIFIISNLPAGIHILTAVYSGNSILSGSTSAAFNEVVGLTQTTTTLTALPTQSTFGQAVNLVTTVTPTNATGTITYRDGSDVVGTAVLNGGTATFSTSDLAVGSHSLIASYPGDNSFASSQSAPITVQVNPASTTTVLTANPTSSAPGQGVVLTAKVTPASATGSVTFRDGTNTIGTANIASGSASTTVSSLSTGSHSLTAAYNGDGSFAPSTSSAITVSVGLTATTTALSVSPANSSAGQSVTFTATVAPVAASGTVTFQEGTTSLGTGTLANGTATFTTSSLPPGAHSVTAVYSGNSTFATSTSTSVTATVGGVTTTTSLSVSPNPPTAGQTVTMTATVTPAAATGTVTFLDDTTSLGTGTLTNGTATFTTSSLAAGPHSLTASYGGDATRAGSTSTVFNLTVNPASVVRITAPTALPAGIVNVPYSQTFTATGGTGTLTWTLFSGTVPGLSLSPGGVLSGTPTTAGTTQLTIRVQDNSGSANATVLGLTIIPTPSPSISVTQPTTTADQPAPQVTLGQAFPVALNATFALSFTPNAASLPANFVNGAVQFAIAAPNTNGTTTLPIAIPANSTAPALLPAVQLGTVAGTITVRLASLTTSTGQSVLPANPPTTTITVPRLAPVIVPGSVRITNVTSTGFTVFLNASSTPRDLTSASLTFTAAAGTQLNGGQSTVTLTSPAGTWFTSTPGVTNGGSFSVTMPFAFSGDTSAIGTVSVTLTNSVGTSTPVSGGK